VAVRLTHPRSITIGLHAERAFPMKLLGAGGISVRAISGLSITYWFGCPHAPDGVHPHLSVDGGGRALGRQLSRGLPLAAIDAATAVDGSTATWRRCQAGRRRAWPEGLVLSSPGLGRR